jgi:hypothetical protein
MSIKNELKGSGRNVGLLASCKWIKNGLLLLKAIRTTEHIQSDIGIINIFTLPTPLDICYDTTHFCFLLKILQDLNSHDEPAYGIRGTR